MLLDVCFGILKAIRVLDFSFKLIATYKYMLTVILIGVHVYSHNAL